MKRMFLALLLFLCLAWTLCAALAEETPYVPGEITSSLFSQAYEAGDAILLDLEAFAAFADGITDDPEARAQLDAIAQVLDAVTLTAGVCRIDDGLRLELAASYDAEPEPIDLTAALSLTGEGAALQSNLIEGQIVTAKWETLLALCGLSDEEITAIMGFASLPAEQKLATLEPLGALLEPYGQILSDFVAGLPMELREDVPAEGDYPAVAQELVIGCTDADLAALLEALAAQLEADEALAPILDELLASLETDTDGLCAALRGAAPELRDSEEYLTLFYGLDEAGNFVYLTLYGEDETGEEAFTIDLCVEPGSAENAFCIWGDALLLDEERYYTDGVAFAMNLTPGEEHPEEVNLLFGMELYMDGEIIAAAQAESSTTPVTTEDGQSGLTVDYAYTYSIADGDDTLNVVMTMDGALQQTAEGGETQAVSGTMETYAGSLVIPASFSVSQQTQPTADGPVSELVYAVSMPDEGIDSCGYRMRLYTRPFDAGAVAALHALALETVSSDEMDALMTQADDALTERMERLLQALPTQAVQLLMEDE